MFFKKCEKEFKLETFEVGDLVKYVRVEKAEAPQTWKRTGGIGIILAAQASAELQSTNTIVYTLLNDGESFECIEVYSITASMEECNVNAFKDFAE